MPLGKLQLQIVQQLEKQGRLSAEQVGALSSRPDEISGDDLDKLLREQHGVTATVVTGIMFLELIVALLQAYVFALLSSVFIGLMQHEH